jgi:hypothetical protein
LAGTPYNATNHAAAVRLAALANNNERKKLAA